MSTEYKIHGFDPEIYPIKLWVAVSVDLSVISRNFKYYPSGDEIEITAPDKFVALTHLVEDQDKFIGILMAFRNKSWATSDYIAHEATHAARFIWDHLGEGQTGIEADAYLVQWIVKCINTAINYR